MPESQHVFHDLYAGKPGVRVERIYQLLDLQHRGEIADEHPARPDDFSCVGQDLPRLREVDQDAINLPNRQTLIGISLGYYPVWRSANKTSDVVACHLAMVGPNINGE